MDAGGYDRELREVAKRDRAREAAFLQKHARTGGPEILSNRIGGRKVPPAGGAFLDKHDPARGKVLCQVPASTKPDVEAAVAAAKAAQPAWAATPLAERCAILRRTADLIERDMERLVRMESEDTGKPVKLAGSLDIPRAARNFRFFADFLMGRREATHETTPGFVNTTHRVPVGVIGLITPWNLPLYLLTWKVAPALGLGNTVVAKPSELTPRTADALADLLAEAGLPDGVYNVIHGLGPEAGEPLVAHPDVRAVSFTGGTATGAKVAAAAGAKKLSLELGGKNASLVFADCDLEATVAGVARAAFTNQGQICLCGSRVLVERSLFPEFTRRLADHVKGLRIGDPLDPTTDLGSLVSQTHRAKVETYLEVARDEDATFHTGGNRPDLPGAIANGAFLEPTILTGLDQDSPLVQEEIFGPVVTVQPFASEDEAVRLANDVRYGLAATVWSKDAKKAQRVAERLHTGMVWVNCWLVRDLAVPFGGVKDSGFGREGGEWSVDFYSEARNICTKVNA